MKSEFIQPIKDDYFVTEEDCKPGLPELVINSELADENLEEFVKRHEEDLEEEQILRIFTQLLLGLHTLQINDIDHRDLKPANILMYQNGQYAKLTDLGLARAYENSRVVAT